MLIGDNDQTNLIGPRGQHERSPLPGAEFAFYPAGEMRATLPIRTTVANRNRWNLGTAVTKVLERPSHDRSVQAATV
jgi:hypothetical protein